MVLRWGATHGNVLIVIVISAVLVGEVVRTFVFMRLRLSQVSLRAILPQVIDMIGIRSDIAGVSDECRQKRTRRASYWSQI